MSGARTVFGGRGGVALLAVMAVLLQASWSRAQDPVITSAVPDVTSQGTVNLDVTINGSGFARGARASFYVTGTTNPGGVTVNSTTYRSSSKLIANINVAASSTVAKYDVEVVLEGGRRGVGLERFRVEIGYKLVQLAAPTGATWSGNGTFCSETRADLRAAGTLGNGTWIRDDQTATCLMKSEAHYWNVVGAPASVLPAGRLPVTRPDKPSQVTGMSRDGLRVGGTVWSADATSSPCSWYTQAVVWEQDESGDWTEMVLPPMPGATVGQCSGISDDGQTAIGYLGPAGLGGNYRSVLWTRVPDTDTWNPPVELEPGQQEASFALGIDRSGALIGGHYRFPDSDTIPVYWEYIAGSWSTHRELLIPGGYLTGKARPGENTALNSVAFLGRIGGPGGVQAAFWASPTSLAQALGGDDSHANDDNGTGTIVGRARNNSSNDRAVRWAPPSYAIYDLNTRLSGSNGWTLTTATGIDAAGRIIGKMSKTVSRGGTTTSGYALIPVGQ